MDNLNVVNDTQQAVVEPASQSVTDTSGTPAGTPADSANAEVAPRGQSKADNHAAAQMRRRAEAAEAENQRLVSGLAKYGYSGANTQEILDQLEAKQTGSTVAQIQQNRAKAQAAVENDPRYQALVEQNIEYAKAEDLRQIQTLDPSVKSVDDLGDDYFKLRAAGIDAKKAFLVVKNSDAPTTPKPANIGPVNDSGNVESEFYTSEQLDRLTSKDLDNPKILKKAMASLTRLGKK